ncbi:MAG: PadR family transcriptional regulator [Candidatus Heimdallarchaeota archaeon]
MFRRHPPSRFHPFRPPMPFGPGMIKDMSQLVFLWTISESPDGITGYDLYKNYEAKQTNVYRTLKEMEVEGFITSTETIVKGRAQKIYKITEKGSERLKNLREEWTNKIAFLIDIVPPERGYHPIKGKKREPRIIRDLRELKTKDEVLDYLEHVKKYYKGRKNRLAKRMENLDQTVKEVDEVIVNVNKQEPFSKEETEKTIREILVKK